MPVGFSFAADPDDRNEWTQFFTAFENGRLALLVDGDDFVFVGRDRVTDTDDRSDGTAAERRAERPPESAHEEVVDPEAERRADEAADQETLDNHRDEEPFESEDGVGPRG